MRTAVLATLWLALGLTGALAQDDSPGKPTEADRQAIDSCMSSAADSGYTLERCIGTVSDACLATPGNDNTVMMGACIDREFTIWDERLNADYKALMARLPDDKKAALKTTQRSWITLRDQTCQLEAGFWDGGTGAGPAAAGCFLRETGHRALTLHGYLGYLDN